MAPFSGWQSNTTIQSALWIFKPDPAVDPLGREIFVETNGVQWYESNQQVIVSSNITNVVLNNNSLVLSCSPGAAKLNQLVIFTNFTNANFLNGQIGRVTGISPTALTFNFIASNYASALESAGATVLDASSRFIELYYASSGVPSTQAPRRLDGPVAARFIYDLEQLFIGGTASSGVEFSDAEIPSGAIDGTNTIFTLAHAPSPAASLILTENGQVLTVGVDYAISGNIVTFINPPAVGYEIVAWYRYGGGSVTAGVEFSDGETPSGTIDGSNTVFNLVHTPVPTASLILVENGQVLAVGVDYTISSDIITFVNPPEAGSEIIAWYRYE
jgi:hypothetical protein